jgi:hypothetical protein
MKEHSIKYHGNPSGGRLADICGHTDRRKEGQQIDRQTERRKDIPKLRRVFDNHKCLKRKICSIFDKLGKDPIYMNTSGSVIVATFVRCQKASV